MATTQEQYEIVYQGICAVAAHCDGAQTQDRVGFNGQDTHFGRRIASVPSSEWTQDVYEEAARIALTYRVQILEYTGIDMGELQVVKDAQDHGTNHIARDDARGYERRSKGANAMAERKVDVHTYKGKVGLGIWYAKKDPDFGALLDVFKGLRAQGRQFDWDSSCNWMPVGEAVEDFILEWDFPVTEAAQALLAQGPAEFFNITLLNDEKVVIDTPYDADLVDAIRSLPGRAYDAGSINHADVHPAIVTFADRHNLTIHPDARAACEGAQAALEAADARALVEGDRRTVMAHVSRQKDPGALPPVFLSMLADVLPADIAERVIV
jgi:hypothetical protein